MGKIDTVCTLRPCALSGSSMYLVHHFLALSLIFSPILKCEAESQREDVPKGLERAASQDRWNSKYWLKKVSYKRVIHFITPCDFSLSGELGDVDVVEWS